MVKIEKLTDESLLRRACASTMHSRDAQSSASLKTMYKAEHSPIRTQLFWIEMTNIPTSVSIHFVRHKIGGEHFVSTNRPDRGGDVGANRITPVRHSMLANAQSLISMSHVRLCHKAESSTLQVMKEIRDAMILVDPDLAEAMVPTCVYRNGICCEPRPCAKGPARMAEEYQEYLS